MKRAMLLALLGAAILAGPARGDSGAQLSPARLDQLDQRGYFTPAFKEAVHQYVKAKMAVASANAEGERMRENLPTLQQQASDLQRQLSTLHKQLDIYEHPEDGDYDMLQGAMKNPDAAPEQRMELAQAFVWSYPTDPRQAEAAQDLAQAQKQIAAQTQAQKEAAATKAAAQAALEKRAAARQLSLSEWQDFLRDMSEEDLLARFGRPQSQGTDYWIYSGEWTTDPSTGAKVGLQVHFNGTRVMAVTAAPAQ